MAAPRAIACSDEKLILGCLSPKNSQIIRRTIGIWQEPPTRTTSSIASWNIPNSNHHTFSKVFTVDSDKRVSTTSSGSYFFTFSSQLSAIASFTHSIVFSNKSIVRSSKISRVISHSRLNFLAVLCLLFLCKKTTNNLISSVRKKS